MYKQTKEITFSNKKDMSILYTKEHLCCFNYDKSSPCIALLTKQKGEVGTYAASEAKIVCLLEGCCKITIEDNDTQNLNKSQAIVIPPSQQYTINFSEDSKLIFIKVRGTSNLCDTYSMDMLLKEKGIKESDEEVLTVDNKILQQLNLLSVYIEDGLSCRIFYESKRKEVLTLLRAYHSKEDLFGFFSSLLSNDVDFSDLVIKKHHEAKNVTELAELTNYSLSGFQKKFKRVFGMSASTWMRNEKLKDIFQDINNKEYTFKELADKYDFSSPSHFNDYCKSNFGATPGDIRKRKIIPELSGMKR